MTMAQHLDFGLDAEQPFFRRGQEITPWEKVTGNRLSMAIDKRLARTKRLAKQITSLRRLGRGQRRSRATSPIADSQIGDSLR